MPIVSKAQQRFMFARHPRIAKRWAKKTDFTGLPERKIPRTTESVRFRMDTLLHALHEGMLANKDRTINPRAPGRTGDVLQQILKRMIAARINIAGVRSGGGTTQSA